MRSALAWTKKTAVTAHVYARFSFACAISVLMLGILASFGGIGYAASSTVDVAKVAKSVVTPAKPKPAPVRRREPVTRPIQARENDNLSSDEVRSTRDDHDLPLRSSRASRPRRHDRALPGDGRWNDRPRLRDQPETRRREADEAQSWSDIPLRDQDQSSNHNFHLTGPGVNKVVTGVGFKGTKTVVLKLKKGTYRFVSDALPGSIHGSFTVS